MTQRTGIAPARPRRRTCTLGAAGSSRSRAGKHNPGPVANAVQTSANLCNDSRCGTVWVAKWAGRRLFPGPAFPGNERRVPTGPMRAVERGRMTLSRTRWPMPRRCSGGTHDHSGPQRIASAYCSDRPTAGSQIASRPAIWVGSSLRDASRRTHDSSLYPFEYAWSESSGLVGRPRYRQAAESFGPWQWIAGRAAISIVDRRSTQFVAGAAFRPNCFELFSRR
jgi:hypothetical protein